MAYKVSNHRPDNLNSKAERDGGEDSCSGGKRRPIEVMQLIRCLFGLDTFTEQQDLRADTENENRQGPFVTEANHKRAPESHLCVFPCPQGCL